MVGSEPLSGLECTRKIRYFTTLPCTWPIAFLRLLRNDADGYGLARQILKCQSLTFANHTLSTPVCYSRPWAQQSVIVFLLYTSYQNESARRADPIMDTISNR